MSERISKEEADYGIGTWYRSCDQCTMWDPPHSCSLVLGRIEPDGVCKYFERVKKAA